MTTITDKESKAWYQRAWELLPEYRQKMFLTLINQYGEKEYFGLEVFSSSISMDANIERIKVLLDGMGYIISGDKKSQTITIK